MSKSDTWMPMYWGDYSRDTGHLNATAHGAYLMLIKHYWCMGEPLTNDDDELWRIACCDSKKEWQKIKPKLVKLFIIEGTTLRQKRVDQELAKSLAITTAKAEAGKKGAEKRWQKDGSAMAEPDDRHKQTDAQSQSQSPREGSVLRTGDKPPPDDPKAVLWREGVSILKNLTDQAEGPAKKQLGKLLDIAKADHSRLLDLLRRAETEQPSEPVPWLMAAAKGQNGHQTTVAGPASWPPGVVPEKDTGRPLVNGYYIEETAENACHAAGIGQDRARDQWPAIIPWLQADVPPQAIRETIQRIAERPGYVRPASLAYFDKPIREQGRQA